MTPLIWVTIGVILVCTPLSVLGSAFLWAVTNILMGSP